MIRSIWRTRCPIPLELRNYNSSLQTSKHDPLKILFCGSDEFSIYSLRALRELQDARPDKIDSIDVVCRPDKRVGRGLKKIQEGSCHYRDEDFDF